MCRLRWEQVESHEEYDGLGEGIAWQAQLQPLCTALVYQDLNTEAPVNWFFNINDTNVGGPFKSASDAKKAAESDLFGVVTTFYKFLGGSTTDQELREKSHFMKLRSMEAMNFLVWKQLRRVRKPESDQLEAEIAVVVDELLEKRASEVAPQEAAV
jgi:uncharacterized UBP type Zn finger protein